MNELKINNETVRRQDRLLDDAGAVALLRGGEYGVLSMVEALGEACGGYGVPLHYVWDGGTVIYFHCAPEGYKLSCLKANPKASFCVVGRTRVISDQFATEYESIVVRGSVSAELPAEERLKALMLMLDKYSPDDREAGVKYTEKMFHRTDVIRLDISSLSGKAKPVTP